jgi:hypothetical protein
LFSRLFCSITYIQCWTLIFWDHHCCRWQHFLFKACINCSGNNYFYVTL